MSIHQKFDNVIKEKGGIPVFRQIQQVMESEIRLAHQRGNALPPESMLAVRFKVNRHTVRRAIDGLVASGYVERRRGVGSFVLNKPLEYDIGPRTRFTETLEALGRTATSSVLRTQRLPAEGGVARRLQMKEGEMALLIESIRYVDDVPFCLISHYFPLHLVPGLKEGYKGGSLHAFIASTFHWQLRRVASVVSSCLPQGKDASHLAIPKTAPVLRVKSVNVRACDGVPIEYALTRFRADRMELHIAP